MAGYRAAMRSDAPKRRPDQWDGQAARRIAGVLERYLFG
jgi:hypothetical protein